MIKRYIVLKPPCSMDGMGPMTKIREFTNKRDAIRWVKTQDGNFGKGEGWAIVENIIDDDGYYVKSSNVFLG